ncbi:shikimate dehydrogenase [Paenibacillus sp. 1011MAR3C5]|uniref:shikimate dehydrogenase n=1 Tax=Paenibacillus sp. 1011MAR3C5 TaxID=1675787 RepID=UPI000E6CA050|nr:shikimate dehydrogenase [Paenibacillus sp. 1011MAR3C5]RJE90868.1 shikimate dehydrogenase [Paenibacillus sp. 1011MAR3C5]
MTGHTARQGIDSHTVLYGVIGDPIRHSKSPIMMNRAFRETAINGAYAAFHITDNKLEDFIRGVRAMGIRGVNVTIPHKLRVMDLLDEIHEGARAIGAVNTIVNDNGRLIGYNTDGIGYVRSLKEEAAPSLEGKHIVVIGAGGASRGIVYALLQEKPARITVTNRTIQRAEELAASLESGGVQLAASSSDRLEELCGDADIVINTTSVGMFPQVDQSPVTGHWLKPGAVASDLIYNPLKTKFLRDAEQQGCIAHGGLGMFIYQGAYAFEYWTGQPAPVAAMKEEVLAALQ